MYSDLDYKIMYAEEQLYIAVANLLSKRPSYIKLQTQANLVISQYEELIGATLSAQDAAEVIKEFKDSLIYAIKHDCYMACELINVIMDSAKKLDILDKINSIDLDELNINGEQEKLDCIRLRPNLDTWRLPQVDTLEDIIDLANEDVLDFVQGTPYRLCYFNLFNDHYDELWAMLTFNKNGIDKLTKEDFINNIINCDKLIESITEADYDIPSNSDECEVVDIDQDTAQNEAASDNTNFGDYIFEKYGVAVSGSATTIDESKVDDDNVDVDQQAEEYEEDDDTDFYPMESYATQIYVYMQILDKYMHIKNKDNIQFTSYGSGIYSVCYDFAKALSLYPEIDNRYLSNTQEIIKDQLDDIDDYLYDVSIYQKRLFIEQWHREICDNAEKVALA